MTSAGSPPSGPAVPERGTIYFRFVVPGTHERSARERGVFSAVYDLERQGELTAVEISWFRDIESWMNTHLKGPDRYSWSSRPNAPERAISWLKAQAVEHVSRMRELVALLKQHGIPVTEHRTERPGYIVYEDEHQVVAMPFERETFTPRPGG